MNKIKLPRRLKKALSYSYILHNRGHQYPKAVRTLLNDNSRANKTLRYLRMEDLCRRTNQSPYRVYESLGGCVTLEDLAGWEEMNALLPPERRRWKIIEGYTAALFNGHTVEELPGVIGEYDM